MTVSKSLITRSPCHECRRWLWSTFVASTGLGASTLKRSYQQEPSARRLYSKLSAPDKASCHGSTRRYLSQTSPVSLRSRLLRSKSVSDNTSSFRGSESTDGDLSSGTVSSETNVKEPSSATARLLAASGAKAAKDAQSTTSTHIPWYLEDQSDMSESTQPTASGQEMPEMPEHSPELLEPVIKHVLDTLGLTHLTVLDLRRMTDPPPALGANLLMVMATARSERHLHASADKLCRWLRTEYKMSPFADGLLGRNEMKIAIRRRTKKAKMMSAVGAKAADGGDIADGLRSEWICVNVGRVEGGMLPDMRQAQADRNIIGFGTGFEGSTIVVQMMTEEKREEINMEGLWDDALRRQERNNQAMARGIVEDNDDEATSGGRVSSTTFSPF